MQPNRTLEFWTEVELPSSLPVPLPPSLCQPILRDKDRKAQPSLTPLSIA